LEGSAQGMAGTQRSFFNLLAARGGEKIEGKAEQRAAIIAMQKRPLDDEVRDIFNTLGDWLAQFIIELLEYLPFKLDHVEAGGKLTDAASGEIMLARAREKLSPLGVQRVQRAEESEFGQAIAMAEGARPRIEEALKMEFDNGKTIYCTVKDLGIRFDNRIPIVMKAPDAGSWAQNAGIQSSKR